MRSRLSKLCVASIALAALLVPGMLAPNVEAQKQGSVAWYPISAVKRVEKPNRERARPAPKTGVQRVALLTLQWHILRRVGDTKQEEADSRQQFQTGDKLKLAVTTNQTGYLYIINQPQGKDGIVLFPDRRINNGENAVLKDKEYVIPSYCPDFDDPRDCWYKMIPPTGNETMVVIFSRDKITTLPNQAGSGYAAVKSELIQQLIADTQQKIKQTTGELALPNRKAVRYATRVQNTNPKDNEELITTIELTHGE